MNQFSADGYVFDATGKLWKCNQWHRIPIPEGIEISATYPRSLAAGFWLVQAPLPPVPAQKTQYQLDEEALVRWKTEHGTTFTSCWFAACHYARQQMAPEGIV